MNVGYFYEFRPPSGKDGSSQRDRENIPVVKTECLEREVKICDQISVSRIVSGDRVKVVKIVPGQYVLIEHSGIYGYGLTFENCLHECEQPQFNKADESL